MPASLDEDPDALNAVVPPWPGPHDVAQLFLGPECVVGRLADEFDVQVQQDVGSNAFLEADLEVGLDAGGAVDFVCHLIGNETIEGQNFSIGNYFCNIKYL